MKALLLLWLLLSAGLRAQEIPIEVDLIAPRHIPYGTMLEGKAAPIEPAWRAPERVCEVCREVVGEAGCLCLAFVTPESATMLKLRLSEALLEVAEGSLELKRPVAVRVVSANQLRRLGGEELLGLYQDEVIYLSSELNNRQAFAVLAHEYGHAWLFHHRIDIGTPDELLFEGFAEFVSFLAVTQVGDREAVERISQSDRSIYGRGARRLIALYRKTGLSTVLQTALHSRTAP